jgi:hypothetical protein
MIEEVLDELHHIPGLGSMMRVGKNLYKKLKDWMFLKTLKESHWEWQRRHALGVRWTPLGEGIEFSNTFARRPEGPETSHIALRSTGDEYDEMTVVIEFKCGESIIDATRYVSNVGKNSRILILHDVPVYQTFFLITEEDYKRAGLIDDGKNVLSGYSTYDNYRVRVTSLTKDGITRRVNLQSQFYTPINQTLANSNDWIVWKGMEWSGVPVNLSVIREQQRFLQSRLWGKIGYWPFRVVLKEGRFKKQPIGRGYVSYYLRCILSSVMLSEPFIKIIYWIPLILRWRKFDPHVPDPDLLEPDLPEPDLPTRPRPSS